jgi:hypothetical protein
MGVASQKKNVPMPWKEPIECPTTPLSPAEHAIIQEKGQKLIQVNPVRLQRVLEGYSLGPEEVAEILERMA